MKQVKDIDGTTREITNSQYKKEEALIHNNTMTYADNIFQCGSCKCEENEEKCKGLIFMYLKSEDNHIFNYYHSDCSEIGDIRHPKDGQDSFSFPLMEIMRFLAEKYGAEKIERLQK